MSILNNININLTPAQVAAKNIKNQTKNTFQNLARTFNEGAKQFWKDPFGVTPSQIAAELGTDAREIFLLHYALGQFIQNIKPESIIEGWSIIGQFTINDDGTVTIHEPEPIPTPEPEPIPELLPEPQPPSVPVTTPETTPESTLEPLI